MRMLASPLFALMFLFTCVKDDSNETKGSVNTKGPGEQKQTVLNILCRGNSLTFGSFASNPDSSYPSRMMRYFGVNAMVRNQGIPGDQTYYTFLSTFADSISSHFLTGRKNIVIAWEIINELTAELIYGLSPSVCIDSSYGRMLQFCQRAKSAGFDVIVGTCIAGNGGWLPAQFDSCRLVINQRIRLNFPQLGIYICDLAADPRFDEVNDANDVTYYTFDKVHLTDGGYRAVYELFLQKVLAVK